MIYTTGTIAGNGSTITGTGTNFTAAGSLIRVGCTLIAFTNPVQVLQLTAVTSASALSVTPAISPAIAAGTKYAILLSDSLSVDGLAQDIAETFGMYQKYMGGFADVMNGAGNVTITINGAQVTVPGQKSLAKKGANSDITSLSGLTTPLSLDQGGLGAKDAAGGRKTLGLGSAATQDTGTARGNVMTAGQQGSPTDLYGYFATAQSGTEDVANWNTIDGPGLYKSVINPYNGTFNYGPTMDAGVYNYCLTFKRYNEVLQQFALPYAGSSTSPGRMFFRGRVVNSWSSWAEFYTTANTTKAADGTLKAASPVVKVFSDGTFETNAESEGCVVTRLKLGEYLIQGCVALNADATWGGIDGGFDIPTDRNKQPLIWLDYEVNADGSILVKTYHRTYPAAPVFARNAIQGVTEGEPIDIPADQFVSVRVEMPQNCIYNQNLITAHAAIEEARAKYEMNQQAESEQPQS